MEFEQKSIQLLNNCLGDLQETLNHSNESIEQIEIQKESKIFKNIKNKSHMYFVHSYEFIPEDKSVISATTDYSSKIVCSVEKDNLFGTQFHPEKSDKIGLQIIKNFINL